MHKDLVMEEDFKTRVANLEKWKEKISTLHANNQTRLLTMISNKYMLLRNKEFNFSLGPSIDEATEATVKIQSLSSTQEAVEWLLKGLSFPPDHINSEDNSSTSLELRMATHAMYCVEGIQRQLQVFMLFLFHYCGVVDSRSHHLKAVGIINILSAGKTIPTKFLVEITVDLVNMVINAAKTSVASYPLLSLSIIDIFEKHCLENAQLLITAYFISMFPNINDGGLIYKTILALSKDVKRNSNMEFPPQYLSAIVTVLINSEQAWEVVRDPKKCQFINNLIPHIIPQNAGGDEYGVEKSIAFWLAFLSSDQLLVWQRFGIILFFLEMLPSKFFTYKTIQIKGEVKTVERKLFSWPVLLLIGPTPEERITAFGEEILKWYWSRPVVSTPYYEAAKRIVLDSLSYDIKLALEASNVYYHWLAISAFDLGMCAIQIQAQSMQYEHPLRQRITQNELIRRVTEMKKTQPIVIETEYTFKYLELVLIYFEDPKKSIPLYLKYCALHHGQTDIYRDVLEMEKRNWMHCKIVFTEHILVKLLPTRVEVGDGFKALYACLLTMAKHFCSVNDLNLFGVNIRKVIHLSYNAVHGIESKPENTRKLLEWTQTCNKIKRGASEENRELQAEFFRMFICAKHNQPLNSSIGEAVAELMALLLEGGTTEQVAKAMCDASIVNEPK